MKRKPKLRWVAITIKSGGYVVYAASLKGWWYAMHCGEILKKTKTKRAAIAACERHARERGGK